MLLYQGVVVTPVIHRHSGGLGTRTQQGTPTQPAKCVTEVSQVITRSICFSAEAVSSNDLNSSPSSTISHESSTGAAAIWPAPWPTWNQKNCELATGAKSSN